MDIEAEIARVIDEHSHIYDSDCGMDFGCECGSIDDYDNSTTTHAQHLAEVLSPLLNRVRAEAAARALRKAREAINHTRNVPSLITLADKFGGYHQGERSGLEMAEGIIARIEQNSEGNET